MVWLISALSVLNVLFLGLIFQRLGSDATWLDPALWLMIVWSLVPVIVAICCTRCFPAFSVITLIITALLNADFAWAIRPNQLVSATAALGLYFNPPVQILAGAFFGALAAGIAYLVRLRHHQRHPRPTTPS